MTDKEWNNVLAHVYDILEVSEDNPQMKATIQRDGIHFFVGNEHGRIEFALHKNESWKATTSAVSIKKPLKRLSQAMTGKEVYIDDL